MCVLLFVYLFLTFKKLQNEKLNSVDNLITWMKDNKIVDGVRVTEERARKLFDDVTDVTNVEFSKFEAVLKKLVDEQTKSFEQFLNMLSKFELTLEKSKLLDNFAVVAGFTSVMET